MNEENPPVGDNQAPAPPGNILEPPPVEEIINVRPADPIMGIFVEQHPPGSGKWNTRMGGEAKLRVDRSSTQSGLQSYTLSL